MPQADAVLHFHLLFLLASEYRGRMCMLFVFCIHRFPALRSIVVCFLEAVPLLVSVAAMLFFFLFIFAGKAVERACSPLRAQTTL